MAKKVHAPFNFVPTPDRFSFQRWGDNLEDIQDIPFEDGYCGTIHLKVETLTPTFIRNGHKQQDEEDFRKAFQSHKASDFNDTRVLRQLVEAHPEYCSFSHMPDGTFFIPATTIKGAVREVVSIMSRGKMSVDPLQKPAIQREIGSKRDATGLYTLLEDQDSIQGGWIRAVGDHYEIVPAKAFYRVSMKQLDDYFQGTLFRKHFEKSNFTNKDEYKTAKYKYKVFEGYHPDTYDISFDVEKRRAYNLGCGSRQGTIVLTGQSSGATDWGMKRTRLSRGKYYDFIFSGRDEYLPYILTEDEFEQYDSVYGDSEDWKVLKTRVNANGEYPVFFRPAEGNHIKDFGLTLLYKLPYNRTPLDLEKSRDLDFYDSRPDMAERLFGFTNKAFYDHDIDNLSVRGRVQFQLLRCTSHRGYYAPQIVTLNSPKITYYPIYIKQQTDPDGRLLGDYQTYNDGQLSGWKRYVMRPVNIARRDVNPKLDSLILPLNPNAVFEGDISFHNLKEAELGALLSALTHHNTPGCYYQLGQGKPYGFGKVSVTATLVEAIPNKQGNATTPVQAMAAFEQEIRRDDPQWLESDTIREFYALSSCGANDAPKTECFDYMTLDVKNPAANQFVAAKKKDQGSAEALVRFSDLLHKRTLTPASLLSPQQIAQLEPEHHERTVAESQERADASAKRREQAKDLAKRLREESLERQRRASAMVEAERRAALEAQKARAEEEEKRNTVARLQGQKDQIIADIKRLLEVSQQVTNFLDNNMLLDADHLCQSVLIVLQQDIIGSPVYQQFLEEVDPIADGRRNTDITPLLERIAAAKSLQASQPLAEALPAKASSTGQVVSTIKKWKKNGNTVTTSEVPAIASKWLELIHNTTKQKNYSDWLGYTPARAGKWKPLQEEIGADLTQLVFDLVSKEIS